MNYNLKPFKYSSHHQLLELVENNKKVLDVACASGYLASFLKEKNCTVFGVDNDLEYVNEAKKHCEAIVLDISKEKINGKFDVIILGDILEHLVNPSMVLNNLKGNLNKDGYILISIPNIVNIYARLQILLGNFDYTDKGIFDRTHLRFFTKKTLLRLIKDNGFTIEHIGYTPIPFYAQFPKAPKLIINLMNNVFYILTKIWPTMFGYQFILKIKLHERFNQ